MKVRTRLFVSALLLLATLSVAPAASWADAGLLRISQADGPYRISVFTEPTPLREDGGRIHVFVADQKTGEPVQDAHAHLRLQSQSDGTAHRLAHAHRRPGGLRLSAAFTAPSPGPFITQIEVTGPRGSGSVSFPIDVEPSQPVLVTLAPALAVPPLGIVLFGLHQLLVRRREARRFALKRVNEREMNT